MESVPEVFHKINAKEVLAGLSLKGTAGVNMRQERHSNATVPVLFGTRHLVRSRLKL